MFVCCSDSVFDAVCGCSKENSNKLEESVRCILLEVTNSICVRFRLSES